MLYQDKFAESAQAFDQVIGVYSLVSDYGSQFLRFGENGPESVFEIQYTNQSNWYDWNCNNYGTKWGDVRTECPINEPEKLVFTFDSAWSNSAVLASRIANDYKCDVLLNHYSIENWEQGYYKFDNSGSLVESHYEILKDPEEIFGKEGDGMSTSEEV